MGATMKMKTNRRQVLKGLGTAAAAGAVLDATWSGPARAQVPEDSGTDPRFLIVLGCAGGASIHDSLMATRASECATPGRMNTFEDALVSSVDGSPFRAVDQDLDALGQIPAGVEGRQAWFLEKHHKQLAVATWERTSVNHAIAQRRSVTGNEAWAGRTLQECVALQHGKGRPLPNVHLAAGGFSDRGTDLSLPIWAYGETVTNPATWPLALDGHKGVKGAPRRSLFEKARALRADKLDRLSRFSKVFGQSQRIQHWRRIRGDARQAIEDMDLISKLMLYPDNDEYPLGDFGLKPSPLLARVAEVFPDLHSDPFQAQAAMAFLLIHYGVSVTVTIAPDGAFLLEDGFEFSFRGRQGDEGTAGEPILPAGSVKNPPIAFDFSHNGHRSVQAMMWRRMFVAADGLMTLLSESEFEGSGGSLWDRSMLYFATDFGRDKTRPENAIHYGTGHNLNNGVAMLSPLVKGDTILGGIDRDTLKLHGCDPQSGRPEPGRLNAEAEVFSGQLAALGVDTAGSGLPDFSCMVS